MEKALFFIGGSVRMLQQIEGHDPIHYDRIYLGHESCFRLMPSLDFLKQFCRSAGVKISLVLPFDLDDGELEELEQWFDSLDQFEGIDEVMINEWGALEVAREKTPFKLGLGRIMSRIKRDPRIDLSTFNPSQRAIFGSGNLTNEIYLKFLKDKGIQRVELDNLPQGIDFDPPSMGLSASLYYPLIPVSFSPFCVQGATHRESPNKFLLKGECRMECLDTIIHTGDDVILAGKGAYMRNESLDAMDLEKFDRIVQVVL